MGIDVVYTEQMAADEMTIKQAMVFLGIKTKVTMRKIADSGAIPFHWVDTRSGRWRMFKKKDLAAFKAKMVKNPMNGLSYLPIDQRKKAK